MLVNGFNEFEGFDDYQLTVKKLSKKALISYH